MRLRVREALGTAIVLAAVLAVAQEPPPAAPTTATTATATTTEETTSKAAPVHGGQKGKKSSSKKGSGKGGKTRGATTSANSTAGTTTSAATQTTATAGSTTTTGTAATSTQPKLPAKNLRAERGDVGKDKEAHSDDLFSAEWFRSYGTLIAAFLFELVALAWAIAALLKLRKKGVSTGRAEHRKDEKAEDFALWLALLAGTDDEGSDVPLVARAAEKLTKLTAEEQRAFVDRFFVEWLRQRGVTIAPADLLSAVTVGSGVLRELRRGTAEVPSTEDAAAQRFRVLTDTASAFTVATQDRDEARLKLAAALTQITAVENEVKREKAGRQTAETAQIDVQTRLDTVSGQLSKQQAFVQEFAAKEAAIRGEAGAKIKAANDKLDAAEKKKSDLEEHLKKANAKITELTGTIETLRRDGAANKAEVERIARGAEVAARLEEMQWVAQKRFARKIDDASISSVFLVAGYLSVFQYLRGVLENDVVLQNVGIINLRTLLEKISSFTGSDDWKPQLRALIPNALDVIEPQVADSSGSPPPEQLLVLSLLNHMGALSGDSIDRHDVRLTPLFFRDDDRNVRGVR